MKKILTQIIFVLTFALTTSTAFAVNESDADAKSKSASLAVGNTAPINSYNQGTDLSRAVGMATAPALTTTLTETCMGSTSAGAGFSGGSFSFGTTWRDTECVNRLNAREIRTYGDVQAAKEIMCSNDVVREAFKKVGRPCADDGGIYTVAAPVVQAPVVEAPAAPVVGTNKKVGDESDEMAKRTQMLLDEAEKSAASMRAKGF